MISRSDLPNDEVNILAPPDVIPERTGTVAACAVAVGVGIPRIVVCLCRGGHTQGGEQRDDKAKDGKLEFLHDFFPRADFLGRGLRLGRGLLLLWPTPGGSGGLYGSP